MCTHTCTAPPTCIGVIHTHHTYPHSRCTHTHTYPPHPTYTRVHTPTYTRILCLYTPHPHPTHMHTCNTYRPHTVPIPPQTPCTCMHIPHTQCSSTYTIHNRSCTHTHTLSINKPSPHPARTHTHTHTCPSHCAILRHTSSKCKLVAD